jgi:L,D-peptidoglycan transpeptidase YkuD (ErfK/YbiS/YcfS/YnhG family)
MKTTHILQVNCEAKTLRFQDMIFDCAIGKNGYTSQKQEGDGKTPLGTFALRQLFWRSDRLGEINHGFKLAQIITADMGWCDAPEHEAYNKLVSLPFTASHEELWRVDVRYDIIIPLGYNDNPTIKGLGSAIFFHLSDDLKVVTEGCIAILTDDMLKLLPHLNEDCIMVIEL